MLGSPCLVIEMRPAPVVPEAHFAAAWLAVNDGPETSQLLEAFVAAMTAQVVRYH